MEENREGTSCEEIKEDKQIKENRETEDIPKEFHEILDEVPEEARHEVKKMIGMSMQMGGVISPQLELMKKMTPEHVTKFLEGQQEASNNQFKEKRDNKIFMGTILFVVLVFVVVLVILLKNSPDILEKVLYSLGGLVAGLLGGYGYGKTQQGE